jgi:L-asparaginase
VTQCRGGAVQMGKYETGKGLQKLGVLSGYDMTTEAALTKLMYLLGNNYTSDRLKKYFQTPLRGEMTVG